MSCPDYRKMNQKKQLRHGCFTDEFRFVGIIAPPKVKRRPGPKPKGHPDYHPPVITKKLGRPKIKSPKPPKVTDDRCKILSCAEADRRIREMDRIKKERGEMGKQSAISECLLRKMKAIAEREEANG
jgi:hypothetical protein